MSTHSRQLLALLLILIVLFFYFDARIPSFSEAENLANIARRGAINGILSVGMTLVIITGGIDLSVGSVLALSGVCLALGSKAAGIPAGLALALAAGLLSGLVNGGAVVWGRVPPFIATLGMMGIARGLAYILSGGQTIHGLPGGLSAAFDWRWGGIQPVPGLLALLALAVGHFALTRTTWGRYCIAIGCNEPAAHLSGVPVAKVKLGVYLAAGFCAGVAAMLQVAKLASGSPLVGEGYELDSIAAVVLGGTSIMGGRGSMAGTLVGVLLMAVLGSGLAQMDVPSYQQKIIIGGMIIVTVMIDQTGILGKIRRWVGAAGRKG